MASKVQESDCWQSGQVVGAGAELSGGGIMGVERTSAGSARTTLKTFIVRQLWGKIFLVVSVEIKEQGKVI